MSREDNNNETNNGEKERALTTAIGQLEKKYGRGAIMALGNSMAERVEAYSTGSLGLDIALGIGGIPRGRITEVYGPESSGKTTLALHITAEVQATGGTVVYIDAEHALDVTYAKKLGVDTSKLLVSQPDCGEQAFEICEALISSGSVDLIVVDSVAALVPRAEIDGEMEDQQPGLQARLMSKAMRKLTAIAAKSNTAILFINQIRMKIGVMFGSPETTTGGNALKFYASVRLDVRRIGQIKEDAESSPTGSRTRVKVVKNKMAAPFREAEFDVVFNEGISRYGEILDIGSDNGIVDKTGAWYSFKGERLGQGREGAKTFLKEHPEVAEEIRSLILSTLGIEPSIARSASVTAATQARAVEAVAAAAKKAEDKKSAEKAEPTISKKADGKKKSDEGRAASA